MEDDDYGFQGGTNMMELPNVFNQMVSGLILRGWSTDISLA